MTNLVQQVWESLEELAREDDEDTLSFLLNNLDDLDDEEIAELIDELDDEDFAVLKDVMGSPDEAFIRKKVRVRKGQRQVKIFKRLSPVQRKKLSRIAKRRAKKQRGRKRSATTKQRIKLSLLKRKRLGIQKTAKK